jgi:esterase/lipase superfamily enzyme
MNREYLKWHSPALGRDMEMLIFGHGGTPYIVFPTSMGRFFDYESRGMIDAVGEKYERGEIQAFCVDSVDAESWYNKWVHPRERVLRHGRYERHLLDEVIPLIRERNSAPLGVTGCSLGGFHSANFAFRHPGLTAHCISMGGAFDAKQFLDGYYDEDCYYNCPMDFIAGASDPHQLDQFGRMRIVLATGETDICLDENRRLSGILHSKGVPHWLDVWGDGTGHDWPWWQAMARKFLY